MSHSDINTLERGKGEGGEYGGEQGEELLF
jgi:hypothetical protein